MKKILVSIAAGAVIYCGAAYMSGYFVSDLSHEQIEQLRANPQSARMNIKIVEYRRGIFSSDVVMSATLPDELPNIGKPEIILDSKLRHGPLLFADGLSVGLFSATSSMRLKTSSPEVDKQIVEVFGPSIGTLTTLGYFNSTYDVHWVLSAFEFKGEGSTVSVAASNMDCTSNQEKLTGNCGFTFGRIELAALDGSKMTIAPIAGTVTTKNLEPGVDLVDMDVSIDEINVQGPNKPPVLLKGLGLRQRQTEKDANIDTSVVFSLARFAGPVTIENLHYTMDFNGFSRQAVKRLTEFSNNLPTEPEAQGAYMQAQMKELLPAVLQDGLSVRLDTGAQYMGTNPQAQWVVQYKAPADGKDIRTLVDPIEYLQLFDSTLLAKLPVSLVPEPIVAPYIDSHIAREGNEYVLRATLKDGNLTIGRTPVPKETVAAFFAQMSQLQQAAAAQQQNPALSAP